MLVKSQVKYIQSLGHKKFRDADGVFVAEGPKIVEELLTSANLSLVQCLATAHWLEAHESFVKEKRKLFLQVKEKELERISFHYAPNHVLAIFTKPVFPETGAGTGLNILLDIIQDPGNLGTIIRTADWFGIKRIVCSEITADAFNPKVVQSAMGSLARVEVLYADLEKYILESPQTPVYAASLEGVDLKEKIQLKNAFLLMGNESKGITPALAALATKKIKIPQRGGAESLNVAVATGILLSWIGGSVEVWK
jgi:RNA methyltransferase, TrmH family